MSVLRKKPFITSLIESLSDEQLTTLQTKLDQGTIDYDLSLPLGNAGVLTSSLAGTIFTCNMLLENNTIVPGICIYKDANNCVLIGYGTNMAHQFIVPVFKLDLTKRIAVPVLENLSIEELRRVVRDVSGGEGGSVLDDYMEPIVDTETEETYVTTKEGVGFYVHGDAAIAGNASFEGETIFDENAEFIKDLSVGGALELDEEGTLGGNMMAAVENVVRESVPDATGYVGKVLMHINTGNSWENYTPVDINYKNAAGSSIGGLKFVKCTQAEYTAITTPDSNTFYIIVG